MAAKPWGFHRLGEVWAARLVSVAGVRRGELVLDIGAGDGALTAQLVAAGARVIAIELHPSRLRQLRTRFADAPVRVVRADATDLRLPRRPFRVVANPPFAARAALLRRLLMPGAAMYAADLVLQRPVVQQIVAAQQASREWTVRRGLAVPRGAFRPPPPVDAAVLVVRRR